MTRRSPSTSASSVSPWSRTHINQNRTSAGSSSPRPARRPGPPPSLLARASTPEQARFIGDQAGGRVFLFLATDDFARDHAAYTAAGVSWVRPPTAHDYGTVAVFEDLYGNRWDLVQLSDGR
jgi:hypothetical protein